MRQLKPEKGPAMIYMVAPTRDMMPIFSLRNLALQAARQLERAVREANAFIYAYAIVPDSIYTLLGFPGECDPAEFMYRYKWLSSRSMVGQDHGEFHDRLYRKGKFKPWMKRFDYQVISSNMQFEARLAYIHNEPVRRGLVSTMPEWEFSSARDWIVGGPGPIHIEKDISIFSWSK